MSTNLKTLTAISALLVLTACGSSDPEEITQGYTPTEALSFFENEAAFSTAENAIEDLTTIDRNTAELKGAVYVQLDESEHVVTGNSMETSALGSANLELTFNNGDVAIDGNVTEIAVWDAERNSDGNISEEKVMDLTGELEISGDYASYNVSGLLSGTTVNGVDFDIDVASVMNDNQLYQSADGDLRITSGGSSNFSSDVEELNGQGLDTYIAAVE